MNRKSASNLRKQSRVKSARSAKSNDRVSLSSRKGSANATTKRENSESRTRIKSANSSNQILSVNSMEDMLHDGIKSAKLGRSKPDVNVEIHKKRKKSAGAPPNFAVKMSSIKEKQQNSTHNASNTSSSESIHRVEEIVRPKVATISPMFSGRPSNFVPSAPNLDESTYENYEKTSTYEMSDRSPQVDSSKNIQQSPPKVTKSKKNCERINEQLQRLDRQQNVMNGQFDIPFHDNNVVVIGNSGAVTAELDDTIYLEKERKFVKQKPSDAYQGDHIVKILIKM